MKIFRIIIGVLLIMSGVSALFTPAATFLSLAWIIGIMLIFSGITNIITYFTQRKKSDVSGLYLINGFLTLIIGMVLTSNAFFALFTDLILVYIFATWLIISGVLQFKMSLDLKKLEQKWIWVMITGALNVIMGIYSYFNPALLALTMGAMLGIWIMILGVSLLSVSSTEE